MNIWALRLRGTTTVETAKTGKLSKSEESYVEAIYGQIKKHGYARVADIAITLKVKPPSVTSMLQKLDERKFVNYTRYRGVLLTRKGKLLSKKLEARHQALKKFLVMIGVSEENAEKDACEIEHKINPETAEKLEKFVNFAQSTPRTMRASTFAELYKNHTGKTKRRQSTCTTGNDRKR